MLKSEKIILFILKVLGYALLLCGPLMILGAVGAFEQDLITGFEWFAEVLFWSFICILGLGVLLLREALIPRCFKSTTKLNKERT